MLVELKVARQNEAPKVDFRIALVCMPFASAKLPSIQIGLMTAVAEAAGVETDAYHFNLDLAAQLSPDLYEHLCEHRGHMTGEWLFAPAAFGPLAPGDDTSYFDVFPEEAAWAAKLGKDRAYFEHLRREVTPAFVESCLAAVNWSRYRVVGFSSTFQQNVACLALARRIKESHPSICTVFGGANMEGEMGPEYARAFPFIDHIVCGEGDLVFPALLRALSVNGSEIQLAGVISRTSGGIRSEGQASPVTNLDASPIPNYSAYFERAIQLGLLPQYKANWVIPFESSRGCWWGQKHHCTFCGLNGIGMAYRAKSSNRLLAELTHQTRKHHVSYFEAVDNILDLKYLPGLFAQIEQAKTDYQFFYEVKANLTRAQIQSLYRGGVRCVQPGIESMSSHVLYLMRKGCTMLQNVRCLKWCLYYNIRVGWNLIWGFPGETEADYEKELKILKWIGHLEPPKCVTRIWLERFSPYYTDRQTFPIRNVRPEKSYEYVYPPHVDMEKIAYFFDYDMAETVPVEVHARTEAYVAEWQKSWDSDQGHTLTYRRTADGTLIDYKRGPDDSGTYTLFGALASIYEFCIETMHTPGQVAEYLGKLPDAYQFPVDEIREALDEFCRRGLMVSEEDKYLGLAIPSNPNW